VPLHLHVSWARSVFVAVTFALPPPSDALQGGEADLTRSVGVQGLEFMVDPAKKNLKSKFRDFSCFGENLPNYRGEEIRGISEGVVVNGGKDLS
jgi:hypothetical protein